MSKWLSQEWLDETRKMADGQPERPGASARMQYIVTGGPDGDIKYYWVLENGKILESQLGELDASAAFMQGRVKVTGNMAKLMSLLPLTNAPEYKELQGQIQEITEF